MTDLAVVEPEFIANSAAHQTEQAEIDIQVATAKRWPRDIDRSLQRMKAMSIRSPKVAAACFYVLPRGGKNIEGGSIRLAEIVYMCWGNLRLKARVIGAEDVFIRAMATSWDLETNVGLERDSLRRIVDSHGRRYSHDMIVTTGNAAASIAIRQAVFASIPRVYVDEIVEHCMQVAAGKRGNLDDEKKRWFAWYEEKGIGRDQVLELLGKDGPEAIEIEDITTLQGLSNALRDGETTLKDVFGQAPVEDGSKKFGFAKKKNGNGGGDKSK